MTKRLDLPRRYRDQIEALLREHVPGVEVWAYGSRVSGRSHEGSDLDLVLRGPDLKRIPSGQLADLIEALEESNVPILVQTHDWARLPERFHREIEREYVMLVAGGEDGVGSEWREVPVSEVASAVIGGTPARNVAEYWGGDIPWATAKDVAAISSRYLDQVQECITEQGLESSAAKLMPEGTVIITARGTVGALAQLRREMTFNQTCYAILPKDELDDSFLFYSLKGTLSEMRSLTYGTVFETITKRTFENWKIPLPPLPEQRAIAHILGTLDDKIELNWRMNETLEEMARALFKSWFVDFDPVRAKAALKHHQSTPPSSPSSITPPSGGSRRDKGVSPPVRRWGAVRRQYTRQTLQKARALRQAQTDAEGLLWHYLRGKQLGGYKFRRQQPIGPYIADFACLSQKLLIEVDGGYHVQRKDYDEQRDRFLRSEGYRVLRFWNNEVFENCFGVLERVYAALEAPPPPPLAATPPRGGSDGSVEREGIDAATAQGGRDWTVERARAYLDEMDPSIAALFPDHFVDSELGEVPAGWEVVPLSEMIEVNPPRSLRRGEIAPYLDMANMPTRGHVPDTVIDRPFGSGMRFTNGDTLVARITPCLENGKTAYVDFLHHDRIGWGSTEYIVMRPMPPLPNEFAYCLARSTGFREFAIQNMTGTSGRQRVPAKALSQFLLPSPPEPIAAKFGKVVQPLFARASEAVRESRTLAALRDALLPKLVSGEVRVPNLESF